MALQIKGFNEDQAKSFQSFVDSLNESQKAKFDEINEKFKTVESLESELKKYGNDLSSISEKLKEIKAMKNEPSKDEAAKSFVDCLRKALASDKEKNGSFKDSERKRTIEIDTKGIVTTTGRIPMWEREPGISKAPDRQNSLLAVVPAGPMSSDNVSWIERVARTNNGAWVGMLEAGGELALSYEEFNVTAKTFSQFMQVPRQQLDDIDWLASEVQTELMDLLNLDLEKAVLNGDTATDSKTFDGILKHAVAFDTVNAIKLDSGVKATDFDVCHAVMAQIARAKFQGTHIFVSVNKAYQMGWTRDGNGQYDRPAFAAFTPTGIMIDGAMVVATPLISAAEGGTGVTDDTIVVFDANKLKLYYRTAPFIEIFDQNSDDAVKFAKTVAIFVRATLRMKVNNYPSMVKGTFAAIKTAIETA